MSYTYILIVYSTSYISLTYSLEKDCLKTYTQKQTFYKECGLVLASILVHGIKVEKEHHMIGQG